VADFLRCWFRRHDYALSLVAVGCHWWLLLLSPLLSICLAMSQVSWPDMPTGLVSVEATAAGLR
jgi:hypothetical protein